MIGIDIYTLLNTKRVTDEDLRAIDFSDTKLTFVFWADGQDSAHCHQATVNGHQETSERRPGSSPWDLRPRCPLRAPLQFPVGEGLGFSCLWVCITDPLMSHCFRSH